MPAPVTPPDATEYNPFYQPYVALVTEPDVLDVLERQAAELPALAAAVAPDRERFRYGEGKWSVRQVVGHLIDSERVFGYRAFCIARGDRASFPGFDEGEYVTASQYDDTSLADLAVEFEAVREANLAFLRRLRPAAWATIGTANGKPVSVRALAWIMAGHVRHHQRVLAERYGVATA